VPKCRQLGTSFFASRKVLKKYEKFPEFPGAPEYPLVLLNRQKTNQNKISITYIQMLIYMIEIGIAIFLVWWFPRWGLRHWDGERSEPYLRGSKEYF